MVSIYKYVTEEAHALALIERGQMRLSTLSHFRNYEDNLVRGDPQDGKLTYQPAAGLTLTKESGEVVELPAGWRFRSSVRADDIFVYCMSCVNSEELAAKFESPFCVEIKNPIHLIGQMRSKVRLRSRLDRRHLYSGPVAYRSLEAAPGADWALPERVAFIKPEGWSWQDEYRIVVGMKGAFDVENVECALEVGDGEKTAVTGGHDPLILSVGDLSGIAELHRF
jgi:hypothetical protein